MIILILQFNLNGELVDVNIVKKNIKNIYIKLNSNNDIIVSAPFKTTTKFIINFVNAHLEKLSKIKKNNFKKRYINLDNQTFYLFGVLKSYEVIEIISSKNEINKYLVFDGKNHKINKKSITDIILLIYKKELNSYLLNHQHKWETTMNVNHHEFSIRIKQTSWASNYVKNKKINYSTKLAAYSFELINYVIIHELSHAKHSNHSLEFWNVVEKYDPDFKIKKKKLNSFTYF